MLDLMLSAPMVPFSLALALLFGLLILELVFALIGGTLLGLGGDADIDMPGLETPDLGDLDLDIDLDGAGFDPGDLELPELGDGAPEPDTASPGALSWLGLGRMPALIWLATVLLAFGLAGTTLQAVSQALIGRLLPAWIAIVPSAVIALWFAGRFGALFARLLPRDETQSLSERHLGRRKGIVTQGTASRGRPAEVKVTDRFGNTHYLRAEPLRDTAEIQQGTEVLVLRHKIEGGYFLVPLSA